MSADKLDQAAATINKMLQSELATIRATLRVVLETQAQMYADIVVLSGTPLDDENYQKLQDEWKQDTAKLIGKILEGDVEQT